MVRMTHLRATPVIRSRRQMKPKGMHILVWRKKTSRTIQDKKASLRAKMRPLKRIHRP
jgi:hypothetical protein